MLLYIHYFNFLLLNVFCMIQRPQSYESISDLTLLLLYSLYTEKYYFLFITSEKR